MSLQLEMPRAWPLHLLYFLQVRPQSAPGADVLGDPDFLGARLLVDDVAFRESGSVFRTASRALRSSVLTGALSLPLSTGRHGVMLQWRKWGSSVPLWFSQPGVFGGFVAGRSLIAEGLHMTEGSVTALAPLPPPLPLPDGADAPTLATAGLAADHWLDVPGTLRQVQLVAERTTL